MKKLLKIRIEEFRRLPTALLTLAMFAGFASVGQAQDMPELVVTAQRLEAPELASELRHDLRSGATDAVWETRVTVAAALGIRLTGEDRPVRIAGSGAGKRG